MQSVTIIVEFLFLSFCCVCLFYILKNLIAIEVDLTLVFFSDNMVKQKSSVSNHLNDAMCNDSNSKNVEINKETCLLFQASNDKEKNVLVKSYSNSRRNTIINKFKEQESRATTENAKQRIGNPRVNKNAEKCKKKPKDLKNINTDNLDQICRRPTTIRLKIEEEHETVELIKEIIENVSKDSFGRIASISEGIYHIGFKDNQVMNKFLMDGFMFKGKRIQPTLFDNKFTIVNIKDLPFNIEPTQVNQALSQYGEIICYKIIKYQEEEISWLETGEMKIGMFMFKPVPMFLFINNERIMLSQRRLVEVCSSCGKECFVKEDEERSNISDEEDSDVNSADEDNSKEQFEKVTSKKDSAIVENADKDNCKEHFKKVKCGKEDSKVENADNNKTKCTRKDTEKEDSAADDDEDKIQGAYKDAERENVEEKDSDVECANEDSEVESDDESSEVDSTEEYRKIDCADDDSDREEIADKDDFTDKEILSEEDNGMKSEEEDGADDDDSGYYLENSNRQSDDEHKDQVGNAQDKHKRSNNKSEKYISNDKDDDKVTSMIAKRLRMEQQFLQTKTVKERTFLDTISTHIHRSDFDCERVLVTLMDKVKDSLSLELGRRVNRNLLAKVMDNHNYWGKWYKTVQDREKVNWNACYWTISEEYRKADIKSF